MDSYGLVLALIVVNYVAISATNKSKWGDVLTVILTGCTLIFTLRTSAARPIWQLLALIYLLASTLLTLISIAAPTQNQLSQAVSILGGLLLLGLPLVILRRIIASPNVTTEILLGAVCVYLLLGFSFAFVFQADSYLAGAPFFVGVPQPTANDYFFFSYTTLTTVGYGNLIPASSIGQSLSMLEALFGQVYLVVVVARLVSLWGAPSPRPSRARRSTSTGMFLRESEEPTSRNANGDTAHPRQ